MERLPGVCPTPSAERSLRARPSGPPRGRSSRAGAEDALASSSPPTPGPQPPGAPLPNGQPSGAECRGQWGHGCWRVRIQPALCLRATSARAGPSQRSEAP